MTTEKKASLVNDIPVSKETLSVAEYKAMLEKGVPIEFVRRAKNQDCISARSKNSSKIRSNINYTAD